MKVPIEHLAWSRTREAKKKCLETTVQHHELKGTSTALRSTARLELAKFLMLGQ